MFDETESKEQKTLKEDELDKVVGGDYVPDTKCPECRQEKLWYIGYNLYCKGCGWSSANQKREKRR